MAATPSPADQPAAPAKPAAPNATSQSSATKDQQHPLWNQDRQIVNGLLEAQPSDYNLAELARLRIRYHGFPGARDIQADLDRVLQQWQLTEDMLFARTREIHQTGQVYRGRTSQRDDWS